jgi:hypothetical protein
MWKEIKKLANKIQNRAVNFITLITNNNNNIPKKSKL